MSFSVTGFTSPTVTPSDYSTVITFDSNDYKIDESTNDILFSIICTLPCKTCSAGLSTECTSCYQNTAVTQNIFFDSDLLTCNDICVDGKFEDISLYKCSPCDSNCLTCQGSANFCETCKQTTAFTILYAQSNTTQTCVSSCPQGMYPNTAVSPTTCTDCVSPCATCSDL